MLTAFIGRVFLYASIQRLGAMRASTIKRLNPFFAVLLGVLVLGESVSGGMGWGALLILASSALLVQAQSHRQAAPGAAAPAAARQLVNLGYTCTARRRRRRRRSARRWATCCARPGCRRPPTRSSAP